MVVLVTPNNPNGALPSPGLLEKVLLRCREIHALLLVDECFLGFTDALSMRRYIKEKPSECSSLKKSPEAEAGRLSFPALLVLDAFTKTHAMAGLRLGWISCADPSRILSLKNAGPCWSVSSVAQAAGLAALSCDAKLTEAKALIRNERAFLTKELTALGIRVYPSEANFLLLESSRPLFSLLLEKGILIRHCGNYEGLGEQFYRICISTHSINEALLEALREVI